MYGFRSCLDELQGILDDYAVGSSFSNVLIFVSESSAARLPLGSETRAVRKTPLRAPAHRTFPDSVPDSYGGRERRCCQTWQWVYQEGHHHKPSLTLGRTGSLLAVEAIKLLAFWGLLGHPKTQKGW